MDDKLLAKKIAEELKAVDFCSWIWSMVENRGVVPNEILESALLDAIKKARC